MLPLSFAQRRLWFIDRLEDTGAAYNVPTALRLTGPLDVAALRGALADVVGRHEPLRTVFPEKDGSSCQRVIDADAARPHLPVVALSEDEVDAAVRRSVALPFDLTRPPFRAELFELGPLDHVLLLVAHHIATDGWSTGPLLGDLAAAYRSRTDGGKPGLEELPVRYADYTLWQRELLGDPADPDSVHAREADHWRQVLDGMPEVLSLPADRPRPPVAGHQGGRTPFRCGPERFRALARLARDRRCTPFMVVHAAVAVLLSRMGAGEDLPIGAVVSGRQDEELDGMVGFFVNTLVLRTDLSGDPSFTELLERVRRTDLDAFAHQDLPFDLLVAALNPPRSPAHHPLFQVMIALGAHSQDGPDFGAVAATPLAVDGPPSAKFDLTFQLAERHGGPGTAHDLDGYLEYAAGLFDHRTAEGLCERLLRVLDAVLEDPSRTVHRIDVLSAEERHRTLVEWNATDRRLPAGTLPAALAARAAADPGAPAVVSGRSTLTYGELHARAGRLAARLTVAGAGPGIPVAVALPRSADLVVAVLAVLTAGGAYLPVDPEHPAARTADVLADARPVCVVTDRVTRGELPDTGTPVVLVDGPAPPRAGRSRPAAVPGPAADDPAYVIYTSGTTGRPKGVAVPHAALGNRLRWMQGTYPLSRTDRVLHKTQVGFDVSLWELLWPLCEGAVLVLAEPGEHRDPARLARTVRESGVTVAHFVPSMLDHFLAEAEAGAHGGLRRIFCSGEALSRETVREFHRVLPGVALENLYGPTEAAVDVTYRSCPPGEAGPVPIGRPVWNTRVYVLDRMLQPCPPGVPGELYLGGVQLALGYVNRPGLTAACFVADPHHGSGTRMYRTGDIVRWRPDGSLDYLGRADQQVKLRGQRLELGEVESLLAEDGSVGSACAVVRTDTGGGQLLVAYVTPAHRPGPGGAAPRRPEPARLRALLAARLPRAMVPGAVVVLDRLPLSHNGKLDRAALPAPRAEATRESRAPGDPAEAAAARITAELLGLPSVGVDDDFFGHGGNSLLAIRLARRLTRALGVEVPVQAVFRWPTVSKLIGNLSAPGGGPVAEGTAPLLALRPGGRRTPLFFVHPGTGLGWCYFRLLEDLDADWPVHALQARGLTGGQDAHRLPGSVEEMADDYIARIRTVQPGGPYHLLGWSFGGLVAHAMATRLQQAGERVDLLVAFDSFPEPPGPVPHEAGEEELVSAALRNLLDGAPGPAGGRGIDEATVQELRRRFPPLAGADPSRVRSAVRVGMNNVALMGRFTPARFEGDLTLLTARREPPRDGRSGGTPPADSWRPYVSGQVTVLPVDCDHYEMFTTAVPETARLLGAALDARRTGQTEETS
ncbi:non-ribosomal peptide synthetase [Streptomyces sp. IBSBF 2435]|uniref:non-ribosomal peptide synthetase n=1 Tax=Streptomyces sp. IBSBF 2435 TaxID=2903531 RepID=UPI002FDC0E8F